MRLPYLISIVCHIWNPNDILDVHIMVVPSQEQHALPLRHLAQPVGYAPAYLPVIPTIQRVHPAVTVGHADQILLELVPAIADEPAAPLQQLSGETIGLVDASIP